LKVFFINEDFRFISLLELAKRSNLCPFTIYYNIVNNHSNDDANKVGNVRLFDILQQNDNTQDSPFFGHLREKPGLRYLFGFRQKSIDKT